MLINLIFFVVIYIKMQEKFFTLGELSTEDRRRKE